MCRAQNRQQDTSWTTSFSIRNVGPNQYCCKRCATNSRCHTSQPFDMDSNAWIGCTRDTVQKTPPKWPSQKSPTWSVGMANHRYSTNIGHWRFSEETLRDWKDVRRYIQLQTGSPIQFKGMLWDRRWIAPSIGICPQTWWFVYRNAFLIMKLSNPPSFRAVRALIASQSAFEIYLFKTIICSSVKMKKSHSFPLKANPPKLFHWLIFDEGHRTFYLKFKTK